MLHIQHFILQWFVWETTRLRQVLYPWPQDRVLSGQTGKKLGELTRPQYGSVSQRSADDYYLSAPGNSGNEYEYQNGSCVNKAFMHTDKVNISGLSNDNREFQALVNNDIIGNETERYQWQWPLGAVLPHNFSIPERTNDVHYIGGQSSQMKLAAWEHELSFSPDEDQRQFLLQGVLKGFRIVDNTSIPTYECSNYRSCEVGQANDYLSRLFRQEINQGLLIPTRVRPHCVHAIGAIEKKDGTFRPITDCRRPLGSSINNFMTDTCRPFSYNTLDLVCDRLSKGDFMACTDIKAAYRSVTIWPQHWRYQGFHWKDNGGSSYYCDTRLSFGLKCAPYIFNSISDFIVQAMCRRGYPHIMNYLDDFFCWGSTFVECARTQNALIKLLGQLGFRVAWSKCSSPSTSCIFLGV